MNSLTRLARASAAGLVAATVGWSIPAYSAPADVELLKSYVGDWRGRGTLTGANTETVQCRLSLKTGNQDKINYSGRCALAGTTLSINGTMAWVDASKRYEAVMTSNATFSGVAVGKKSGNGIVFDLRERGEDEAGNDMTMSSTVALQNGAISVSFEVVFNESGDVIRASVPFSK